MNMRWNALLHSPFEREAQLQPQQRRWWLGWLQLFCAWVLCMLLCANIALVLAQGLPHEAKEMTVGKPVGCMVRGAATPSDSGASIHGAQVDPMKRRTLPC
ncbi:hypothetical protein [Variovorax sp. PAMC26660]|uniref:hypothetical protein n=1 Tax=Variovorax sp. PAMC26660 TaxID=2762322 RepID=UPI0021C35AC1|nr:hypothetical protein [Variovorax sp. PAMC26660]